MGLRIARTGNTRLRRRLAVLVVSLAGTCADARTVSWLDLPCLTDPRSASWWDARNWDGGTIPLPTDAVALAADPACDARTIIHLGEFTTAQNEPFAGERAACEGISVRGGSFALDLGGILSTWTMPALEHDLGRLSVGPAEGTDTAAAPSELALRAGRVSFGEIVVQGQDIDGTDGSAWLRVGADVRAHAERIVLGSRADTTAGRLVIDGRSADLEVARDIVVGSGGPGVLEIRSGTLETGVLLGLGYASRIGAGEGARAEVHVNGYAAQWRDHETVQMNASGEALLAITDGGEAHFDGLHAGGDTDADAMIEVRGFGTKLNVADGAFIGEGARLHILGGARGTFDGGANASLEIRGRTHRPAEVLVDGPTTWLTADGTRLLVGGVSSLRLSGGAMAWAGTLTVGDFSALDPTAMDPTAPDSEVVVCGRGTVLLAGTVDVGSFGGSPGTLRLADEGEADVHSIVVGPAGRLELAPSTRFRAGVCRNSGVIAGAGTIDLEADGAAMSNAGTLRIGLGGDAPSTMHIRGGLDHGDAPRFGSGGPVMEFDVFEDGTTDRLVAQGPVRLSGDLHLSVHGSLRAGQRFDLLEAETIDGRFARITSDGAGERLGLEAVYGPGGVAVEAVALGGLDLALAERLSVGGFTTAAIRAVSGDRLLAVDAPVIWSTDDPVIATVDADGTVRGLAAGTTMLRAASAGLASALPVTVDPFPEPALIERISVDRIGGDEEPIAIQASLSGSGDLVVYEARGSGLAPEILVRDRARGVTIPLDVAPDGSFVAGRSHAPAISRDGRWVLFRTESSDLFAGIDDLPLGGSFVLADVRTGRLERIGSELGEPLFAWNASAISADGDIVVLRVQRVDQIDPPGTWTEALVVLDRAAGTTEHIATIDGSSTRPGLQPELSLTPDGRFVVFSAGIDGLTDPDSLLTEIRIHDRASGQTERLTGAWLDDPAGRQIAIAPQHAISDDGRFVVFAVSRVSMVDQTLQSWSELYLHDRLLGQNTVLASGHAQGSGIGSPVISGDGRWIAFASGIDDLVPDDTNGGDDTFLVDRTRGDIRRISRTFDDRQVEASSQWGITLTPDASAIAWSSTSRHIAPFETDDDEYDVVLRRFHPADFDRSGAVDMLDVVGFLEDVALGRAWCDLSADGTVDLFDVLSFFERF